MKVPMLFGVGCFATLLGYGTTDLLGRARRYMRHRKGLQPLGGSGEEEHDLPVMKTSVAVGVYLAVSTNIRYQVCVSMRNDRSTSACTHGDKTTCFSSFSSL